MTDLVPILLETHGPADSGLTEWEPIPAAALNAGTPVQRGHQYFADPSGRLTAGVWDCTPMTTVMEPYSVDEFMVVLEGSVTIVQADGRAETMCAGDCFAIPKGLDCAWHQDEYIRKFYVIFDDPAAAPTSDPKRLQLTRLDLGAALPPIGEQDTSRYRNGVPVQHLHNAFSDASGQMNVGLWDTTDMHTRPLPFARNELMHLLEGEVTLTNGDGQRFGFRAGQTFMVPKGISYQWDSSGYVRKVYCTFTPK